ncbi:MAG: AgmX/PglI C-terminal domain-containing protein [Polyangiaceae bacterium]|nr:AgmX/PglI C-terminal domain-containing protein [Polyangiaceae bacterium]
MSTHVTTPAASIDHELSSLTEDATRESTSVSIAWGGSVLHVAEIAAGGELFVGEEQHRNLRTDFLIPAERLGATRAPLVVSEGGVTYAVALPGAVGTLVTRDGVETSVAELVARGVARPYAGLRGAHLVPMTAGAALTTELGDLVFKVRAGVAGRRTPRALLADKSVLAVVALSFAAHAGLLSGFAFFKPRISAADDDESRREQVVMMQQLLRASAEREDEAKEKRDDAADSAEGGSEGAAAKSPTGAAGKDTAPKTNGRMAIKGEKDNPNPQLARERARTEAASFGIIGLLNAGAGGDPNAPTAPWGGPISDGRDALSARGNFWGATLDDSFGSGLGLYGVGEGADGKHESIGLGQIGFGRGRAAGGDLDGFGLSRGKTMGDHVVKSPPSVRVGVTSVSGRLPSDVIQRIVRQNFGRFRMCYEQGLRNNPSLSGRVSVRFAIDRAGHVASVGNSGSDLPDSKVVSCVVSSFSGLSFPEPENGIVTVVYPITFTPGA